MDFNESPSSMDNLFQDFDLDNYDFPYLPISANDLSINENFEEELLSKFDNISCECPFHANNNIIFLCLEKSCTQKKLCAKCIEDDIKSKKRHVILHSDFFLHYSMESINETLEKNKSNLKSMQQIINSPIFNIFQTLSEDIDNNSYFSEMAEPDLNKMKEFSDTIITDIHTIATDYKENLKKVYEPKLLKHLKECLIDFTHLRNHYDFLNSQIVPMEMTDSFDNLYSFDKFWGQIQKNREVFEKFPFKTELNKINSRIEKFKFHEENSFLQNHFFSRVLNEIIPRFTPLLFKKIQQKEDLKSEGNSVTKQMKSQSQLKSNTPQSEIKKSNKDNSNQKTQIVCDEIVYEEKISNSIEINKKKKSKKKKKNKRNKRDYSSDSSYSRSRSRSRIRNSKPESQKYISNEISPIFEKDLPYLLLNDMAIIGPLSTEEFYLAVCSNHDLYISVFPITKSIPQNSISLYGHTKKPFKLIYNDNRKLLLSGGMDWTVRIWNALTWALLCIFEDENHCPLVCMSYNKELDLTASYHDEIISIWNIQNNKTVMFSNFKGGVANPQEMLYFSELETNGTVKMNYIIIGDMEGALYFYTQDLNKNFINKKIARNHKGGIFRLFYLKKSGIIISAGTEDNFVFFWSTNNFSLVKNFAFHEFKRIRGIYCDENSLVASSGEKEIIVVNMENQENIRHFIVNDFEFMDCIKLEINNGKIIVIYSKDVRRNLYCLKVVYFN